MVRNTASGQPLNEKPTVIDTLAKIPMVEEQAKSENPIEGAKFITDAPVRFNAPLMQLRGNDHHTKSLMNRVATGEATESEREAFERHVEKRRSLPSLRGLDDPSFNPAPPTKSQHRDQSGFQPTSLLSAIQKPLHGAAVPVSSTPQQSDSPKNWKLEYIVPKSWIQSLEQQCETPLSGGMASGPDAVVEMLDQKRQMLIEEEQKQMKYGTVESTWERDHTRLLDVHPCNYMPHERVEFRKLVDKHMEAQRQLSNLLLRGAPGPRPFKKVEFATKATMIGSQEDQTPSVKKATRENAAKYCQPLCDFLTDNPTVFHAVHALKKQLLEAGWTELSEREKWNLKPSGSYFVERNGSSLIAFSVGSQYKPGNGAAIVAGHVDAVTAKLKPISEVPNKAGYLQLGVAPYAGGLSETWWDRDLGIGGRVLVKEDDKIVTKLVKLDWPIARIPTLAPHFGAAAQGPFNLETQMVPIVGLEGTEDVRHPEETDAFRNPPLLGGSNWNIGSFVNTQPPALVKAIGSALGMSSNSYTNIVNWELELFDVQPATMGGLNLDFIYAGRLDDKLCSWAAVQALIESHATENADSSLIKVAAVFDNEEIGSLLRQGAKGNFLPSTIERAVSCLAKGPVGPNLIGRTYANSFMVSSDVTHAVNPNFLNAYLEKHAPHLNVGIAVSADPNGHVTSDAISTAIFKRCADKVGAKLQVFQIRNDSRSGGTVGPMLSAATGIRAIDAGIPQLSMHSIRATTGSLDPGLGVIMFLGFFNEFEKVDQEFK